MKLEFYCVKDELANEFLLPGLFKDENLAKRSFKTEVCNNPLWKENSSDFSLFKLGSFDNETGEIVSKVEKIVGGRSVVD